MAEIETSHEREMFALKFEMHLVATSHQTRGLACGHAFEEECRSTLPDESSLQRAKGVQTASFTFTVW